MACFQKFGLILFLIPCLCHGASIRQGQLTSVNGYYLFHNSMQTSSVLYVSSKLQCIKLCAENNQCHAVNYNWIFQTCEMLPFDSYTSGSCVVIDSDWTMIQMDIKSQWTLLFRAHHGVNKSIYSAWMTNQNQSVPSDCKLVQTNVHCYSVYRNPIIDTDWNFQEINVSLYKNATEVKRMTFSAIGTNKSTWFNQSKLLVSPWMNLTSTYPIMHSFSIQGDMNSSHSRRFFLCSYLSGCTLDHVFFVIIDAGTYNRSCVYELHSSYPQFLYAAGQSSTYFSSGLYEKADVFAIFGH